MRLLAVAILLAAGCEGDTKPPSASAPEGQPEVPRGPPEPVYTSPVCCAPERTCALGDGARPLGATCACPTPGGDLQGHVC